MIPVRIVVPISAPITIMMTMRLFTSHGPFPKARRKYRYRPHEETCSLRVLLLLLRQLQHPRYLQYKRHHP